MRSFQCHLLLCCELVCSVPVWLFFFFSPFFNCAAIGTFTIYQGIISGDVGKQSEELLSGGLLGTEGSKAFHG